MPVLEAPILQTKKPLTHNRVEEWRSRVRRGGPTLRNVLVIDDDPDYRVWIRILVGTEGYCVLERDGGRKADAVLCQDCSLVILDLVMPDGEGLETLQRLRCEGVTTKILVVSGAEDSDICRSSRATSAPTRLPVSRLPPPICDASSNYSCGRPPPEMASQ